ncbi:RNA replication protein [Frankliniella fusca]|uniref:RNA replication protein n=1 Tax=Frankliniella fusca TaxID=407009 RepID=A0AAE1HC34_9NEOP|nr:RNA replication protein [Frankliniella fusca]
MDCVGSCDLVRIVGTINWCKYNNHINLHLVVQIVITKGNIPPNAYKNFLLLHTGAYILSSPKFVKNPDMITVAGIVLDEFVSTSVHVFDESFVVYNVHSLKHLAAECSEHGELEGDPTMSASLGIKGINGIRRHRMGGSGDVALEEVTRIDVSINKKFLD